MKVSHVRIHWLTVDEAGSRLGKGRSEVLRLIHEGPLYATVLDGELMVRASDVDEVRS